MRRFRFSLEPALQLRRRLEEQAQVELAQRQRRLTQEETRLHTLQEALRRHDERRADLQLRDVQLQELAAADQYARSLGLAIAEQRQRVTEAATQVEVCRASLQNCRSEREALERLRDRRLAEHRAEQLRGEQQSLDESSILRWRRSDR